MNIIKLKDIVMPNECRFSQFFNEQLKGKYAYWVKMRYIFPMSSLSYRTYIQYEQLDNVYMLGPDILPHIDLYSEECSMYNFAQEYVDQDATELANAISDYRTANEYVADIDIDINKLRKFRSWLASEVLMLNTGVDGDYLDVLSPNVIHMLEYYKNNMYNDVVKQLMVFGKEDVFKLVSTDNGCSCCGNVSNLYKLSGVYSGCDALSIYTNNIHSLMVQTFEDANFWMQFNKDFIGVFKKYIDNIVKTGLVINNNESGQPVYISCNCNSSKINAANDILKNLSEALQYIIDDEVKGHVNFIHDALHNWAEQLYDYMSWEIK